MEQIDNADLENVTGGAGMLGQIVQQFLGPLVSQLGGGLGNLIMSKLSGAGGQGQMQAQGGQPGGGQQMQA